MRKIRTRFAPSPTGMLHIGGIRTALYNYLIAQKYNGDFILRIEDTDSKRFVPEAQDYIIRTLNWLKIIPNEGIINGGEYGPYIQSLRSDIYQNYAKILIDNGAAYYAFDTNEELDAMHKRLIETHNSSPQYNSVTREYMRNSLTLSHKETEKLINESGKYVIRFKTPKNKIIRYHDIVHGWIKVNSNTLDDKILLKSDGMATYHLANVVDDYLMKISHVIRGEEWLPSTPLHVLIYQAFGWENEMPIFVHLPLLLNPSGNGKLSKRDCYDGEMTIFPLSWWNNEQKRNILGFKELGFLPEAIINALSLLGWNPGNNVEIMSLDELIHNFSLEKLCKSGARFNYEKFKWFNHHYLLKNYDFNKDIIAKLKHEDIKFNLNQIEAVTNIIKERCKLTTDIWEQSKIFFYQPQQYKNDKLTSEQINKSLNFIKEFINKIHDIPYWTFDTLHTVCQEYMKNNNLSYTNIMPTFRLILFGELNGPDVIKSIIILGKEETIKRINNFIHHVYKERENT